MAPHIDILMNTFINKPEFITNDRRSQRPPTRQFTVSAESMTSRHEVLFQHTDLTNKRILDIGCCCAATGAWVLDKGAQHYTGVELQQGLYKVAEQNMSQYYDDTRYNIINAGAEEFLDSVTDNYDIVTMLGVQHCMFDWFKIIKKITSISKEIIIETKHPYHGFRKLFPEASNNFLYEKWEQLSLVEFTNTGSNSEDGGTWKFNGVGISIKALEDACGYLGWTRDRLISERAIEMYPDLYSLNNVSDCPRYVFRATVGKKTRWELADVYKNS